MFKIYLFLWRQFEINSVFLFYTWILKESGYKATIAYNKSTITNNRNRARNIIWFNPSYSQNVRTLEKHSSRLIKKHFLRDRRLHKVLDKHTLNLSLSFPRVFRKTEKKTCLALLSVISVIMIAKYSQQKTYIDCSVTECFSWW